MPTPVRPLLSGACLLSAAVLAACSDAAAPTSPLAPAGISRQGGNGGGGGGGGGGAVTPGAATSPVPTTPPASDVLMRESFGENDGARPTSGNGALRATFTGIPPALKSFWIEYPGSKDTQWLASDAGQKWTFGGRGFPGNPYELPSPYQPFGNGNANSFSPTFPTSFPTALMPITVALPSGGYEFSMEGWPETSPGAYLAIGFTNSAVLTSNLTSTGSLWLRVTDPSGLGAPLHYELRTGSLATGRLLVQGDGGVRGWNHMALRVSPAAGTVTLTFADSLVGTFPAAVPQPKYLAFEGIGAVDDLVLRK